MKTGGTLEYRKQILDHKTKLKNLHDQQALEREKMALQHATTMAQQKTQNLAQINDLKSRHQLNLAQDSIRREKQLNHFQESLQKVKDHTHAEMSQIRKSNEKKKIDQKMVQQQEFQNNLQKQELRLQDLEHESNISLKKAQRLADAKQIEIERDHRNDKKQMLDSHKTQQNMKKDEYVQIKHHQSGKFENDLQRQQHLHKKTIVENERNHHKSIKEKNIIYDKRNKLVEENGVKKNNQIKKLYAEKYTNLFNKQEKQLQHLGHKKESIINRLKNMVKKDVKLEMIKDKDPFYQKMTLSPELKMDENNETYLLSIKVPEHDAKNIQLTASERTLKLSMDRFFKFESTNEQGQESRVNKSQSVITKVPVEEIVDSKKIERSYQDGVLTFKIGLA